MHTLSNIARRLNLEAGATHLPSLILLTDEKRVPNPHEAVAQLPAGSAVIFRHYSDPNRKKLAMSLRTICDIHGLLMIVSNDVKLAMDTGADGVHLPEYRIISPTLDILIWQRSRQGFLTGAAHTPSALRAALLMGVDAVLLSPVFPSVSHPKHFHLGLTRFMKLSRLVSVPIYALGGVNDITAKRLIGSGAAGIAAIGAIVNCIK